LKYRRLTCALVAAGVEWRKTFCIEEGPIWTRCAFVIALASLALVFGAQLGGAGNPAGHCEGVLGAR
jgi:hypothetical protein